MNYLLAAAPDPGTVDVSKPSLEQQISRVQDDLENMRAENARLHCTLKNFKMLERKLAALLRRRDEALLLQQRKQIRKLERARLKGISKRLAHL